MSSPAVDGGIVYVGSYTGMVYGLNASDGVQVWNFRRATAFFLLLPLLMAECSLEPTMGTVFIVLMVRQGSSCGTVRRAVKFGLPRGF